MHQNTCGREWKNIKKEYVKTESEVRERWRETERRRSEMVLSEMFFILLSKNKIFIIFFLHFQVNFLSNTPVPSSPLRKGDNAYVYYKLIEII